MAYGLGAPAPLKSTGVRSRRALIWFVTVAGVLAILFLWSAVLHGIGSCGGDVGQRMVELVRRMFWPLLAILVLTATPMVCIVILEWRVMSTRRGFRWLLPPVVASTIIAWMLFLTICLTLGLGNPDGVECVVDYGFYGRVVMWVEVGSIPVSIAGLICTTVLLVVGRAERTSLANNDGQV